MIRFVLPLLAMVIFNVPGDASGVDVWPPVTPGDNEWVDKHTGHTVIRLSRREGAHWGFYFHQNPYTSKGDQMVFMGATDQGRCAFSIDLKTLEMRQITTVSTGFEVVAPKSRILYYLSGDKVYSTHIDTCETRTVATVPGHYAFGRGLTVNSDETVLAGCYCMGEEKFYQSGMEREQWIRAIWKSQLPNALYTIDIATGKINEFYQENAWLGHVQFSPMDPTLIAFCHEGPSHEVDRMWLIRSDGTGLRKLHEKKYPKELQTHEFWSPDGAKVWCDYQLPWGPAKVMPCLFNITFPKFYVASIDVQTNVLTAYPIKMRYASRHFNISPDQSMFCGDGEGGRFRLWRAQHWIYLFRVENGKLRPEKLCSMKGHNYKSGPEPNTHFTPDGKWVVFQSDITGTPQVYAVQVGRER